MLGQDERRRHISYKIYLIKPFAYSTHICHCIILRDKPQSTKILIKKVRWMMCSQINQFAYTLNIILIQNTTLVLESELYYIFSLYLLKLTSLQHR